MSSSYLYSPFMLHQEVTQFQNRLGRGMTQCSDDAAAVITPDVQKDARKMKKVEDTVIKCISKTVDSHVEMLNPMKKRIIAELKKLPK